MNASRSTGPFSASPPTVNSSSNWSMTRTRQGGAGAAVSASEPDSESATRPAAVLTACSTSIGASPGAADSDRYTDTGSAPATSARCIASSRNGLPVGRITRRGQLCDPGPRTPAASRGINPALSSDDLPAPDSPATSSIPVPSSRAKAAAPTGRPTRRARKKTARLAPGMAPAPDKDTLGQRRAPARRLPVQGGQYLRGRGAAAGRRHEQRAHRPGQAQRGSQQLGGVLAGGPVDAPLQVAD